MRGRRCRGGRPVLSLKTRPAEDRFHFCLKDVEAMFLANDFGCTPAQFFSERLVAEQLSESLLQRAGISGRNEKPVDAVVDNVGGATRRYSHHGLGKSHGFQKNQAETFSRAGRAKRSACA